jgi:hypothetical protein
MLIRIRGLTCHDEYTAGHGLAHFSSRNAGTAGGAERSRRQPLQEARELVESTYSLRADVLRDLLKRCASVKTVRLCLQLGREQSQP